MSWRTGALTSVALLIAGGQALWAQSFEYEGRRDGFRIYTATVYTGYSSLALPNANFNYLLGAVPTGGDVLTGGSLSVGWTHFGPQSSFSITYSPSYQGFVQNSQWNALNHSLSLNFNRKLGSKWALTLSGAGAVNSLYQTMFTPSTLSNAAAVPTTFDELASAMLSGRFTNDQLAGVLTGSSGLESPDQTALYGNRVLSGSLSSSLSYTHSRRFSLRFGASANRYQVLNGQGTGAALAVVPRTTGGSATAGMTYSLTPQTDFGLDATSTRTSSVIQDVYMSRAMVSLARRIGNRWFMQGRGGPAWVTALRQTYELPQGTQYAFGGSLGYKTSIQSFMATVDRTPVDSYGTGAGYTLSVGGTYRRHRPGSPWTLSGSLQQQRMRGTIYEELDGWMATAILSRVLGFHSSMQFTYTYLNESGTFLGSPRDIEVHTGQVAFVWAERPPR